MSTNIDNIIGIAVHWEHRSFKEQGIDREPTIHIGAVANALERKGIQTERGNINREIIKNNMLLEQAKEMLIFVFYRGMHKFCKNPGCFLTKMFFSV